MILVIFGPFEGAFDCLCGTFPGGHVFMRRSLCSDLHGSFGAEGWM
jgi:hypothetical protein